MGIEVDLILRQKDRGRSCALGDVHMESKLGYRFERRWNGLDKKINSTVTSLFL